MSDHAILMIVVGFGVFFVIGDAIWKIGGAQRRLNRIEKRLGLDR